jgi:hypothetical protein
VLALAAGYTTSKVGFWDFLFIYNHANFIGGWS